MGGCQNYGPFLGTLNIRGRIIIGIQKGTIFLTTTQVDPNLNPKPKHPVTSRNKYSLSGSLLETVVKFL